MVDVKTYMEKKKRGLVKVQRFGKKYLVVQRKFDPNTGEEMDPDFIPISIEAVQRAIEDLEGQLAALRELKSDLEATTD